MDFNSLQDWFGKFSHVQCFGMKHSKMNHSIFYCHTSSRKCAYLVVYVDDMFIIENDTLKNLPIEMTLVHSLSNKGSWST